MLLVVIVDVKGYIVKTRHHKELPNEYFKCLNKKKKTKLTVKRKECYTE